MLISRLRRDRCSSESFEIHFCLSNFETGGAEVLELEEAPADEVKKAVIERAFLGSGVAVSAAFLLIRPDIAASGM